MKVQKQEKTLQKQEKTIQKQDETSQSEDMTSGLKLSNLRDIYLIILTGFLFVLMLKLFTPFLTTLLIALLLVALFQPFYKAVERGTNSLFATLISTIVVLLIVVIPTIFLTMIIVNGLGSAVSAMSEFVKMNFAGGEGELTLLNDINNTLFTINPAWEIDPGLIQQEVLKVITSAGEFWSGLLVDLIKNTGNFFVQFVVFVIALVLLFRDFDKLPKVFKRYVPLNDDLEQNLLTEFLSTGKSLLVGIVLIAVIHATVSTGVFFLFTLFGVIEMEVLAILFVLVFFASFIPGGSQLVWIPTGVIVALSSGLIPGVILMLLCFVSMNLIDTLIRPVLSRGSSKLHPLLSLISLLGGIAIYGAGGLLYGPLIAVMFVTIMSAYNIRFKS